MTRHFITMASACGSASLDPEISRRGMQGGGTSMAGMSSGEMTPALKHGFFSSTEVP
jgi:hypothetical protein